MEEIPILTFYFNSQTPISTIQDIHNLLHFNNINFNFYIRDEKFTFELIDMSSKSDINPSIVQNLTTLPHFISDELIDFNYNFAKIKPSQISYIDIPLPDNSNSVKLGHGYFTMIAGPCAVESYDQLFLTTKFAKSTGAHMIRAGAFKPRSSPYSFHGLEKSAMHLIKSVRKHFNIPFVTEITDISYLDLFEDIDVIQVGARNMQNFTLLKHIAKYNKPILLKRGFANTINELLLSAEYILNYGNSNVILCERGIRSFDSSTRNLFDISCFPIVKNLSHLPIIADPSHAAGRSDIIPSLSLAAISAGADGLIVETHPNPKAALCDANQALSFEQFSSLSEKCFNLANFLQLSCN